MNLTIGSEEKVVLLLSKKNLNENEIEDLRKLFASYMDWSKVIGYLQLHRVTGNAWLNICNFILKENFHITNFYIVRVIEMIYKAQTELANEHFKLTLEVLKELKKNNIRYALLKGIILSGYVYEDIGLRMFNDCDVLIHPSDIKQAELVLTNLGYIQGMYSYEQKKILPASRREIIERPILTHEVYPFVKTGKEKFLNVHIIDLQFSIDLMSNVRTDDVVDKLLEKSIEVNIMDNPISTLNWENHLLFLCIHLYKEAIYLSEVNRYKELLLYKINDIFNLCNSNDIKIDWDQFIQDVILNNFQEAVYFALYYVNCVYNGESEILNNLLLKIKPKDISYLHEVIIDNERKFSWSQPVLERLFNMNKPAKLKGI
ncbi:nucleotidyltransferase domain-containing protein [Bacillus pseudomycoides]|uniref:nucleotidyltransferase domain-containing protein n=1 Tax=Bacillus pseudomycoides TaxID=64104 RepID=UPI000BFA23A5|nr:nucleotidyltransferase family protein [Bacillus pseudomycoides]PGD73687.1 hypothetical protein COM46_21655 [Bacillus pseudomycoides]